MRRCGEGDWQGSGCLEYDDWTETEREIQTDRQTDRQTGRDKDRERDGQAERQRIFDSFET